MKIPKDQLLTSDYNTLFTRDPATFFEALLINILWDKQPESIDHKLIERQRTIFLKWLRFYTDWVKEETTTETEGRTKSQLKGVVLRTQEQAYIAGQLHAFRNLPIKKTTLGKSVDMKAVTQLIHDLRALEHSREQAAKETANQ